MAVLTTCFAKAVSKNRFLSILPVCMFMLQRVLWNGWHSVFLLLFASLCFAQPFNSGSTASLRIEEMEKQTFLHQASFPSSPLTSNYDITYHRLEWQLNPNDTVPSISGKITTYFVPLIPNFSEIHFDADTALKIDSVIFHGQPLVFSHENETMTAVFSSSLLKGQTDSVTVHYHGIPSSKGFGSFVRQTHGDSSVPIISTLSQPYGAKTWWVCKQSLDDKIDSIDVIVTNPAAYRAASNGLLISEQTSNGNRISHWKHRYPIVAYLIAVAVTNYVDYTEYVHIKNDSFPVVNFVYPEDLQKAKEQTSSLLPAMQLYDSLFGAYPFTKEKYGHAQFGWGGGMEHQTMTFIGGFSFDLLAHEAAHQWFGNKITCRSWQDIWLNEGFATYLTGLCFEHLFNGKYWMTWKTNQINGVPPKGSVWVDDTTSVSRIFNGDLSYTKGAMLLHQLRWELGDSLFFTAVRNYINDSLLAYNFVTTGDLKKHLETVSMRDLTGFFNDWFYGQGFPSYYIEWQQNSSKHVTIQVVQKQTHPSVPFFETKLPLMLKGSTDDTMLVLQHAFSGQSFSVPLDFTVDSLFVDPDKKIISNYNIVLKKEPTLNIYPNPVSRLLRIDYNISSVTSFSAHFFNLLGEEVKTVRSEQKSIVVDVSDLTDGIYFIKVDNKVSKTVIMNGMQDKP